MDSSDCSRIRASARMGLRDNSEGSISVRTIASPMSQVAKSAEKFSARNRQVLSNMKSINRFVMCNHSAQIHFLRVPKLILSLFPNRLFR